MNTRPTRSNLGPLLGPFREYLRLLARPQLSPRLAGKVDLSGVVPQTFLEVYQGRDAFPPDAAGQAAWLRRALADNLTDEVRRALVKKKPLWRYPSGRLPPG
jgi:hypothetical protein